MQTSQAVDFIRIGRDAEWNVTGASQVLIELPGVLNSWLITSEYVGTSKHVEERIVYDLVCEKDGKFYNFDVTELVKLNKQAAVLDAQEQVLNEEIARMDAVFAKLEVVESAYRKRFGPIPPITER